MSATFDTLSYAKRLRDAGFSSEQTEALAEGLRAVVDENLATKGDIAALGRDMKDVERRITLRLGGISVAGVIVLGVLMKVL